MEELWRENLEEEDTCKYCFSDKDVLQFADGPVCKPCNDKRSESYKKPVILVTGKIPALIGKDGQEY